MKSAPAGVRSINSTFFFSLHPSLLDQFLVSNRSLLPCPHRVHLRREPTWQCDPFACCHMADRGFKLLKQAVGGAMQLIVFNLTRQVRNLRNRINHVQVDCTDGLLYWREHRDHSNRRGLGFALLSRRSARYRAKVVGQEASTGKCVLLSTSKAAHKWMTAWRDESGGCFWSCRPPLMSLREPWLVPSMSFR